MQKKQNAQNWERVKSLPQKQSNALQGPNEERHPNIFRKTEGRMETLGDVQK